MHRGSGFRCASLPGVFFSAAVSAAPSSEKYRENASLVNCLISIDL